MDYTLIDWNEVWKKQMRKHCSVNGGKDCALLWKKESAAEYWKMVQETQQERIKKTIRGILVTRRSRVLDIGSGPGVLTIPLARMVSHVTSIDPSEGMISMLKEKLAEQGIGNIHCVQKRWEDVDISRDLRPPYDVVLASLSLGMYDIRESIQKMLNATSRFVYLFWFAGEPSWDVHARTLIPLLHGTDFHPMPRSDVLFNVLYQMGIYPHVEVYPYEHLNIFARKEEAVTYFSHRFCAFTEKQRGILREYLADILQEEKGFLVLRSPAACLKMWWEKSLAEYQALPLHVCAQAQRGYAGVGDGHMR